MSTETMFLKVRALANMNATYGQYDSISIVIPKEVRDAACLTEDDKLLFEVIGRQVRIRYSDKGNFYKTGVIGVNAKNFKHPLNTGIQLDVPFYVDGDDLVIDLPEDLFFITKGFGNLRPLTKGFAQCKA